MTKPLMIAAFAGLSALAFVPVMAVETPPLISRQMLFADASASNVAISPDGAWIAFLRPVNGVANLWVAPADAPEKAKALTSYEGRGISPWPGPQWSSDSRVILYLRDDGGNENFQLYGLVATGGEPVDLTRNSKVRTELRYISPTIADEVVVGFNDRDPRYHDVYRVNIHTGARTLITPADEMIEIMVDNDFVPRLGKRADDDGGYTYFARRQDEWVPVVQRPVADSFSASTVGMTQNGDALVIDSGGSDKGNLVALDPRTGKMRVLASGIQADIAHVLTDADTGNPLVVSEEFLVPSWRAVDPRYAPTLAAIKEQLGGPFEIVSHSHNQDRWIIRASDKGMPDRFYLWDRQTRKISLLMSSYPDLDRLTLAPMKPVLIKSRDGLDLTSYLTLPAGSDQDGNGIPDQPIPLVLTVHGGPWSRDSLGFVPEAQWLANRGYAVLSVNFRGSTGMGKAFINAGDFEWAGKMHTDLIDGVNWAISQKIADPQKVAIHGLSYGGYSALVGLTFTPKTFACAVDMSGPANLVTTFQTTPPYWKAFRAQLKSRVGDYETEEGRTLLLSRSPSMFADKVERPLLIGQGENDPRVIRAEPDQMVAALKARNIPVTYVVYADEGHVFQRPESRRSFFAMAEKLYGNCLGGPVEPVGKDFEGANMEIVEGGGLFDKK
jgi:dipeptidyl aminopeptidase/acylaminoacyl peptidase